MKQVVLEKYHCMGNDYLVFDPNKNDLELNAENIKKMCSRHFGIGADGILAGPYLGENDFYVRIYNADGSEAEKSGNGMGIFAKYLRDAGYVQKTTISWKTLGGEETVFYLNEDATRVKISMGHPTFWSDEIPVTGERREMVNQTMVFGKIPYVTTCLSMGNPHCVIWMNEISKEMVCRNGYCSRLRSICKDGYHKDFYRLDRWSFLWSFPASNCWYCSCSASGNMGFRSSI